MAVAAVPFSLRLDEATRARLEKEARRLDRSASQVAQRAIQCYLDAQEALRQEIDAAVEEADAGVFISAEAMHAWMETWGTDHEAPPPEADVFPDKPR
jgi:predicted transcriptional regulator